MINIEKVKNLFENTPLKCTDFIVDKESQVYDACQFKLNNFLIHYRKAKSTPKKEGQFVTFWKRIPSGVIAPFDESDNFKFLVVSVKTENKSGYFVFKKSTLVDKKIVSNNSIEGKRAFRIYPPCSMPKSKQAFASQKWQLSYFVNKENINDFLIENLILEVKKTS